MKHTLRSLQENLISTISFFIATGPWKGSFIVKHANIEKCNHLIMRVLSIPCWYVCPSVNPNEVA